MTWCILKHRVLDLIHELPGCPGRHNKKKEDDDIMKRMAIREYYLYSANSMSVWDLS
jgi:hypothetical protein